MTNESAHPLRARGFGRSIPHAHAPLQIPCSTCYAPATSPDQGAFREARCARGHITLTTQAAMTTHSNWLATRLNTAPSPQ